MQTSRYAPRQHRICGVSLPADGVPVHQIDGRESSVTASVLRCTRLRDACWGVYHVIAAGLFSDPRISIGTVWKTPDRRDLATRLVRSGREPMHGGYIDQLRE
jgi:Uncharacterized conserved protein (DUF2285)